MSEQQFSPISIYDCFSQKSSQPTRNFSFVIMQSSNLPTIPSVCSGSDVIYVTVQLGQCPSPFVQLYQQQQQQLSRIELFNPQIPQWIRPKLIREVANSQKCGWMESGWREYIIQNSRMFYFGKKGLFQKNSMYNTTRQSPQSLSIMAAGWPSYFPIALMYNALCVQLSYGDNIGFRTLLLLRLLLLRSFYSSYSV